MADEAGAHRRRRALVTGGAGFIGSHLCERLLSEVYGDPLVHPQPEEYWGNVYDEAITMARAMRGTA